MKKLDYIDALRGMAILLVMMVHVSHFGEFRSTNNYFREIVWAGRWGVPLFYIASSFTLMLSMTERNKKELYPTSNFFIRRFFRIAPLYYLAIGYYLFQDGIGNRYSLCDEPSITRMNIVSNILFIHGFYPYWFNSVVPGGWSVAVEFSFYCLLPFLFKYISNLSEAIYFLVFSLVIMCLSNAFVPDWHFIPCQRLWQEYSSMYILFQLPVFALGVVMYHFVLGDHKLDIRKPLMTLSFVTIVLTALFGFKATFPPNLLYSIGFFVLGIVLSKTSWSFVSNPVILHIGKISYSMYLTHIGVLYWLNKSGVISLIDASLPNWHITSYLIRYSITLLFTMAISTLTHKIIEVPFQEIGRNIIKKREGKRA